MNWTKILERSGVPEPPGYHETIARIKSKPDKPRVKPSRKTKKRPKRKQHLPMKEIKTLLPEELVERLSTEAKEKGIHRSELIRERLSQPPNHFGLTTSDFHKAVTKVRRRSSYGLDRQQAESLVATVFNELFSPGHGD